MSVTTPEFQQVSINFKQILYKLHSISAKFSKVQLNFLLNMIKTDLKHEDLGLPWGIGFIQNWRLRTIIPDHMLIADHHGKSPEHRTEQLLYNSGPWNSAITKMWRTDSKRRNTCNEDNKVQREGQGVNSNDCGLCHVESVLLQASIWETSYWQRSQGI